MKTILVPTDFSKGAENALTYAVNLAQKEKAGILLLHAFRVSYPTSEIPVAMVIDEISLTEMKAKEKLKKICLKIVKAKNVKCDYICKEGSAIDVILETSQKILPEFIIMGTKGASGVKEILMGSNTAKVIEKTKFPVIAVPENASFRRIKQISFATDYHVSDIDVIKKLTKTAKLFNAKIDILHASDEDLTREVEEIGIQRFKTLISKKIKYNKISFKVLYGEHLEKVLQNHIEEESPDLLVMSTHDKNLAERIFRVNSTKKMVYHINIPLLTFHHKKGSVISI